MAKDIHDILNEIDALRSELEAQLDSRRTRLGWKLHDGLVQFEHGVIDEHRRLRMGIARFLASSNPLTLLTAPVIYSLIVPFALIDLWISLYQAICFRAWGIARVNRADYVRFDRARLGYLNWIEALNCAYCSYANGVIAYVREVGSRTEQYWCPIKHALRIREPHPRYDGFVDYGDAQGYRARLDALRDALRADTRSPG